MSRRERERKFRRDNAPKLTQDGRQVVSQATARYIHSAPRKLALLAKELRDKEVVEAFDYLRLTHKPSAVPHIEKLLKSAVANARDVEADPLSLTIGEIRVEGAPMMKRIRPASMGRANRVRKRLSHLHIKLTRD